MATNKKPKAPKASRKTTKPAAKSPEADPTTDEALRELPVKFADAPDMPVGVAIGEWTGLANQAKTLQAAFAKVGISAVVIETLARFARRLKAVEQRWQTARKGVSLSAKERKLLDEGEKLDSKLLAGGRWALREDDDAQAELSRIAEGSGLADTVSDLRDLGAFWEANKDHLHVTLITDKDLRRAAELVEALGPAADKEASDLDAASALELRNRCFWAGDRLAKEIREGGRYAFADQPKIASRFVSRYRTSAVRRARKKSQEGKKPGGGAPPSGGEPPK